MTTDREPTRFVDIVVTQVAWADKLAREAVMDTCGLPTVERWVVTARDDERGNLIVRVFGR